MKLEIWSDYVCPFCYIGKKTLEEALEHFPEKDKLEIEFKSFQLDPNTPPYSGQNYFESMVEKFGSIERAKEMTSGVAEKAKLSGLEFNFETMKSTNTFDAHRLMKLAKKHEKDFILSEKIFYAHFTDSKDIGDMDVLADLADSVGLDNKEVHEVLQDKERFAIDVDTDIAEARQFGISSVPAFVFDRKYLVSGAQPVEAFTQALNQIAKDANPAPAFENLNTNDISEESCGDDGCDISK